MSNETTFTLNIRPVGGHLEVTIPEIGAVIATTGTTRDEAVETAQCAIIAALSRRRKERKREPKAS